MLRTLASNAGEDGRRSVVFELETLGAPGVGRWVDAEEAAALAACDDAAAVSGWAASLDTDGALRVPWARPGWYRRASAWLDAQLEALARPRTGPTRQVKAWSISSVLRAPTAEGDVWLKAVPPLFGQEPALTAALDRRHPGRVTSVLAVDVERGWMLMEDLGGEALSDLGDLAPAEDALREYAAIQLAWAGDADGLAALGCEDRSLDALESDVAETLADPLLVELPSGLSAEECEGLPRLRETLSRACERFRALGLPATLEHGDLHPGNVRVREGGPVFYDWTDGCVSMPLLVLAQFVGEDAAAAERRRLVEAYVGAWDWHAQAARLRGALDDAGVLGRFHLAVSYRRIAHATEPGQRWQLGSAFPYYVRRLLAETAAGQ